MTNIQELYTQNQFRDSEHLWFWFIASHEVRSDLHRGNGTNPRPCELIDVERLVTQLYLTGRLTREQLDVMKKYGDLRRGPNQYVFAENKDAALWLSAMRILAIAARIKGWIE